MLIDVPRFIEGERAYWEDLEAILSKLETNPDLRMDFAQMKRFHYLYERASADLAKIATFAAEREIRSYLESLVGRAYSEIHENRQKSHSFSPFRWFLNTFPQVFRKQIRAFYLAVGVTSVGILFGGLAITFDPVAKEVLMPFPHLQVNPAERVFQEEQAREDRLAGQKATFSSYLMTHNTKVSILTMAMGITFGIGTILLLFYNGVILGSVVFDYILEGQTQFLAGWLLPHGSVEIPAILIAGQAGLVLAGCLISGKQRATFRTRLRMISADLATLIGGVAVLLIWAGIIEAFLSQYHEPVIPYIAKITFGLLELALLVFFLSRSGRESDAAV